MGFCLAKEYKMTDYNELTKELLAQGYTAKNHPEWVSCRGGNKENPLDNFDGGFTYFYYHVANFVYETPCGVQILGKNTHAGLCWMGQEYKHENHIVTCKCPKGVPDCKQRGEPFASAGSGILIMTCPCRPSEKPYNPEGSWEELNKQYDDEKALAQERLIQEKNGRACKWQMRWNEEQQKWVHNYQPSTCLHAYCTEQVCRITGKPIPKEKANIYYDMVYQGRDYSQDGTLFEGQRFKSISKNHQYFEKTVRQDIAENLLRLQRQFIIQTIKTNDRMFDAVTKWRAEKGEIDLTISVENLRVETKKTRDLDEDLQLAREGVKISYADDEEKQRKDAKRERKAKRDDGLYKRIAGKIIESGLLALNEKDRRWAAKNIEKADLIQMQREYEREAKKKKEEPKQLTLFDLMN